MKNPRLQPLQKVQAPAIEPVVKGDYYIIAEYIKAHCAVHETYTMTSEDLLKAIPQNKRATSIASNFEKIHGLSYRKTEGENNNDTYVFFVEPTREELMIKISDITKSSMYWQENYFESQRKSNIKHSKIELLEEENTQLKSKIEKIVSISDKYIILSVLSGLAVGILGCYLYLHINGL